MRDRVEDEIARARNQGEVDSDWYLDTYPDVRMLGMDPVEHFVRIGRRLGRQSRPNAGALRARNAEESHQYVRGAVEGVRRGCLVGWLIDLRSERNTLEVCVQVDGTFYGKFAASIKRDDLVRTFGLHSGGGFEIPLPLIPPAVDRVTITVLDALDDTPLKRSPHLLRRGAGAFIPTSTSVTDVPAVTIVVPVFNGAPVVESCLAAVVRNTTLDAKLVIVDDASTEPEVATVLERYREFKAVTIVRNPRNRGFTASVNVGMRLAGNSDVVLLNSDTEVAPGWLRNLSIAARSRRRVGTVTAMSNNAGAFSVPEIGVENDPPHWLLRDDFGRVVSQNSLGALPAVPTGNGFCMYIRRACLEDVGYFDEEAFPRGYGEENDFCMKALRRGWHNLIDDRTLVFHRRGASFGDEKIKLAESGRAVIEERYADYGVQVRKFHTSRDILAMRHRVRAVTTVTRSAEPVRPRYLFVLSTKTGGTPQSNRDLMNAIRHEVDTWLLSSDSKRIDLYRVSANRDTHVAGHELFEPLEPLLHTSDEYDAVLENWLLSHSIELVHIRHLAWHSLGLISVCRRLSIPVVFSFHDFYAICPTVNLTDERFVACGGRCTASPGDCTPELWPNATFPALKHQWVHTWREMHERQISQCDAFVSSSFDTKRTVVGNLPSLAGRRFEVIPHGRNFGMMRDLAGPRTATQPLRVLFPGHITEKKGSLLIEELIRLDVTGRLEVHVMGTISASSDVADRIRQHGPYERGEFASIVGSIQPHLGGVFSLVPETYCHTLSELWSVGVPVAGFDVGAVGERIAESGAGWVVPHGDPTALYQSLLRIADDRSGYEEKRGSVLRWQKTMGLAVSPSWMAGRYLDLYRSVLEERKPFRTSVPAPQKPHVALLTHGDVKDFGAPGSVHVRMWERASNHASRPLLFRRTTPESIVANECADFDAVLVQRDAVPESLRQDLIEACRRSGVPLILDLDDDLLAVPSEKDPDGRYSSSRESMKSLIRSSTLILASTTTLAGVLRPQARRVALLENRLSPRLWFSPDAVGTEIDLGPRDSDDVRLVYMGSDTHEEDLAVLETPIERLRSAGLKVRLFVVGGSERQAGWYDTVTIPERNYPEFVFWFRRFAKTVDVAVAPLVQTPFNACKSGLKFLEYGAAGLAGLFSVHDEYEKLVARYQAGFCLENDADSWERAIRNVVLNLEQWRQSGAGLRLSLRRDSSLAALEGPLDEAILGVLVPASASERSFRTRL